MTAIITRRHFTAEEYRRVEALGIDPAPAHRLTVEEYELLHMAGVFAPDERVELIRGEIIAMMTSGPRHVRCVNLLNRLLTRAVSDDLFVSVQNPVRIPDNSVPEPDISLVRDHGPDSPPISVADALFVLEVSDSTLTYDRDEKMPFYAEAGIPEAWLVDVAAGAITRYTEPQDGLYRQRVTGRAGDTISSTTVPGLVIPVADVLR